jgi:hypothetical protein
MNNSENEGFRVNTNIEETHTTVKAYTKLFTMQKAIEIQIYMCVRVG